MERILRPAAVVLLAIISIVTGILVARQFIRSKTHQQSTLQGRRLAANIDWTRSDRTLVLALQVRCRYCADSIGFYRTLVPKAANQGIRVVGIFPDDTLEAEEYLRHSELVIPEILRSSLASLGITGTPTILLVNKEGIVDKMWEGKLPPMAEKQVFEALNQNAE
jgi:hypothetical protein